MCAQIIHIVMFVWLVFVSAFAIVSHQQFQRDRRQPFWLPNPSQQHLRPNPYDFINDKAATPRQQITGLVGDGPEIRHNDGMMEDDERIIINRSNLRFLFFANQYNHFFKTATITITTTQDFISVQTCLNVDRFVNLASISVICKRRKKREILQDFSGPDQSPQGDPIEPSDPQQPLLMTILPADVGHLARGSRHLLDDPDFISSSKDDDVIIGRDESTPGNFNYPKVQERFYYPFVATQTVYSVVLNSLVVTKAILLASFRALYCRPSEFVVCST
ncbi:hypothetical protein DAPPUDRAFT_253763 [Daphnia pulex]|uniref:Uncharacterized protein n=1 Tax=Daphnia pulex TaxID=6669 RepID=E9H5C8_DAPPU|nr:hypothetical protein DAPPUDRAFT_253763 [Daphnia pulex]|eukprot:EFX72935.1 hypothetical protein DAPPUDRAFT_253763 [Daphnia pulex]